MSAMMKLCRFLDAKSRPRVGLIEAGDVLDLTSEGIDRLSALLDFEALLPQLSALAGQNLPRFSLASVRLLAPIDAQEVWAAGVTYLRSKKARMEESSFSAIAYDSVYEAARPEIFFKAMPEKVVGPGEAVGIRRDACWNVPEPELALVINSRGHIVGFTAGNDMSSRDIEGENLLYLPQAKIYDRSCALGPCIVVGADEAAARAWTIAVGIVREGREIFSGQTSVSQIKRSFAELASWLTRCQSFPHGAVLLTGTGVVPPSDLTLAAGDRIWIDLSGIGRLENSVTVV